MTYAAQFVRLLHIVSAFILLSGVIGRQLARSEATKSRDFPAFEALIRLGGRFDDLLVRPGSILLFVFGILVAWLGGWPLFGFLQGASANWLLVSLALYLATIPLIVFVFVPRGKVFERAMAEARGRHKVTTNLQAALKDEAVARAHWVEGVLTGVILLLMVTKLF